MCPKCGTNKKSDKLSCCYEGGAWFKNCGDADDFDHTWTDGVKACKGMQSQSKLHHLQKSVESNVGRGSGVSTANGKVYDRLADVIVLTSLLITTLNI